MNFSFERLSEADLPFLLEVRGSCRGFLHDDRKFTLVESQSWFRNHRPEFYLLKLDGQAIGYFRTSNRSPADRSIYVGADLHAAFRGRGLAVPAYAAFFELIREQHGIAIARLEVLSHNTVAIGLYRKLGFEEVERKRAVVVRDGQPVDSIVMQLALS